MELHLFLSPIPLFVKNHQCYLLLTDVIATYSLSDPGPLYRNTTATVCSVSGGNTLIWRSASEELFTFLSHDDPNMMLPASVTEPISAELAIVLTSITPNLT